MGKSQGNYGNVSQVPGAVWVVMWKSLGGYGSFCRVPDWFLGGHRKVIGYMDRVLMGKVGSTVARNFIKYAGWQH